jgi:CRP-like cAMP-binding protein
MSKGPFHKLIYSFERKGYQIGDIILKQRDPIDKILVIEKGTIEVFTECESHEFIVENLHTGTIINFRSIFQNDEMKINMRAKTYCNVLELSNDKLIEIGDYFPEYRKVLMMY